MGKTFLAIPAYGRKRRKGKKPISKWWFGQCLITIIQLLSHLKLVT